jgi:flagellar export protein FliJ
MKIKETAKETLMVEYAEAESQLSAVREIKKRLETRYTEECRSFENKCVRGMKPCDMRDIANFLEELRAKIKRTEAAEKEALKKVEAKRQELAEVIEEIKTLEKLREKQYREYLAEAEKEEVKIREDILAFNITGNAEEDSY